MINNEIESILTEWIYNASAKNNTKLVKDYWLLRYYATGDMSEMFYITNAERKNKILSELDMKLMDAQKVIDALKDLPVDPFGEDEVKKGASKQDTFKDFPEVKPKVQEVKKEVKKEAKKEPVQELIIEKQKEIIVETQKELF